MPFGRRLALSLFVAAWATTVSAHDMWIQPSSFAPAAGEAIKVALRLGIPGPEAEVVPRNPARIVRFAAIDPSKPGNSEAAILGPEGLDPAGLVRFAAPGLELLVYQSNHASIELTADRFEPYLVEEGLEEISKLRASRGEGAVPGREIYSRGLKSLVFVGGNRAGADRAVGLPLELVCETPSANLAAGRQLAFRLLFQGKPVPGALVDLRRTDGRAAPVHSRTDGQGRVSFSLPAAGAWVLTATHMIAAPADSGADWESFWASLTFLAEGS